MDKIDVLILAFDRKDALEVSLKALQDNFDVNKIWFYVDKFYDKETNQAQQELLAFIKGLSIEKEVLRSKENLGTQKAMKEALKWMCKSSNKFLVLEEDIVLTIKSKDFYLENSSLLQKTEPHIVKLGMFYWGFFANKTAIEKMLEIDLGSITDDQYVEVYKKKNVFKNIQHFWLVREKYRRNGVFPWDDEFDMTAKMLDVYITRPNMPTTLHFGEGNSSRLVREKKLYLSHCDHIGIRKGVFFTQK
jgi:hypothetical protein